MTGFGLGELFGRLLVSYLVVLVVLMLVNRFKGKIALEKSKKWYSVVATLVVFVLGVSASISQTGTL